MKCIILLLGLLIFCYGAGHIHCQTLHDNKTDMFSLQYFKNAITYDPNGALNSWNRSNDHCKWKGVSCSLTHPGRVVALDLTGQHLVGDISSTLGNLTFLNTLILSENGFSNQLPPLGRLHRLQYLDLSNNSFQGSIPESLTNCSELTYIDLSRNFLVGEIPDKVDLLSKLSFLRLSYNNLSETIPPSLSNITQIDKIYLSYNHLTGSIPDELGKLTNISLLALGGNKLSGGIPEALFNLSSLRVLALEINMLGKTLPPDMGDKLPNLSFLGLSSNMFEGTIPASLGNSSGLQIIDLSLNNFAGQVPSSFGNLSQLLFLNLDSNKLEARGSEGWKFLDALGNCRMLQKLSLAHNQLQGVIPESIDNLSPDIQQIFLDGNQLSGNVPNSIGKLQGLNALGLSENSLDGTIEWIENMTELQGLFLNSNSFSGSIPSSIGNLINLNELNLAINEFEGFLPPSLGNLSILSSLNLGYNKLQGNISLVGNFKQLFNLSLSSNKFSGEIPDTLSQCQQLINLTMDRNFLIGEIPMSLGNLVDLNLLDLSHNNISGTIPTTLSVLQSLSRLDLSYNKLQGKVPLNGVFGNASAVSLDGNLGLCGGVQDLRMPSCTAIPQIARRRYDLIKVLIPIFGFMSLILLVYFLLLVKKMRRKIYLPETSFGAHFPTVSYNDLAQGTTNFSESNLVGRGSYGSVYRGKLKEPELVVAVKVFDLEMPGAERSFLSECEALRSIQHRNLLPIITACSTVDNSGNVFKALVYEFMPNGNLDAWLHDKGEGKSRKHLDLTQRISIVVNLADALDYLHHDCGRPTIHCDLKPSNILLNDDMTALLGDFGIARFYLDSRSSSTCSSSSIGIKGTIGYIAPGIYTHT